MLKKKSYSNPRFKSKELVQIELNRSFYDGQITMEIAWRVLSEENSFS